MKDGAGWGGIYYFEESSHKLFNSPNLTSCIYCCGPKAPEAAASQLQPEILLFRLLAVSQGETGPRRMGREEREVLIWKHPALRQKSPSGQYINGLSNRHSVEPLCIANEQ